MHIRTRTRMCVTLLPLAMLKCFRIWIDYVCPPCACLSGCARVCVFVYAIMDKKSKVGSERNRIKKLNRFSFWWAFFKSFVIVFLYSLHFVSLFQCARALPISPFCTHSLALALSIIHPYAHSIAFYFSRFALFCSLMPILLLFALKQHEWQREKNWTNIVYLALCSNVWQALFSHSLHMCRNVYVLFSFEHFPLVYILLFVACVRVCFLFSFFFFFE